MKPKVVTFDCANTLVRVRWSPGGFALECARAAGVECPDHARDTYDKLLAARWAEYREVNLTRDEDACDLFWLQLSKDWLAQLGLDSTLARQMSELAPDLLYGTESDLFTVFEDVLPTLDALETRGIRTGVISNWDYSLYRVLRSLDLHDRFEHVIASLHEGVEKPEPELFGIALEKFGVLPAEALHVGDDPVDDLRGAQDFGMGAFLIDRRHNESRRPILASLVDMVAWLDED